MVVQHNLTAMNANRMLNLTVKGQAKSTEKLSSGYKINRAADDAAGLSISEKMRKQIRGLTQASLNAQDGISMVQTAEGALNEVQDMLQRMNELSVKASNGTLSHDDRNYIQNEVDQLVSELNRVSETTKFNETYLLKGRYRLDDPKDFVGLIPDDVISEEIDAQIITRSPAQIRELKTHYMNNGVYGSDVAPATNQTKNTTMNPGTVGFMDFSGLTGNDVMRLVGTGYSVTCSQCSIFMSVMFVDDTNPAEWLPNQVELSPRPATVSAGAMKNFTDYGYITYGNSAGGMNMYVDISKCGTGKDVVDAVMNAYARYNSLNTKSYEEGCGYGMGGNHHVCIASQGGKIAVFDSWSAQGSDYDPDEAQAAVDGGTTYRASGAFQRGVLGNGRQDVEIENDKVRLHVGADATANNGIEVELGNVSDVGLGLRDHIYNWKTGRNEWVLRTDMRTQESARSSIAYISEAIQKVSTMRSRFGAIQNRLEHTINNLDNVVENTTAAESQIRDTDMATEMVRNSNNNVLAQAGEAMLAQSNQSNQGVLSLLG